MLTGLVVALALVGIDDPQAAIATAPAGASSVLIGAQAPEPELSQHGDGLAHGLSTQQQIDQWIATRAAGAGSVIADDGDPWSRDDRRIHGEVSAGIGTGGYSAFSAAVSLPIGETGSLGLSYSTGRNDWRGYGYRRPYDGGLHPFGLERPGF